jgi:hypothetical protein
MSVMADQLSIRAERLRVGDGGLDRLAALVANEPNFY